MPAGTIDPTSAKMVALYPDPNLAGQINNFLFNPVQTNRVDQFNIRTDYRTDKSQIFARFNFLNLANLFRLVHAFLLIGMRRNL
jgi:hypothetical protein